MVTVNVKAMGRGEEMENALVIKDMKENSVWIVLIDILVRNGITHSHCAKVSNTGHIKL